MDRPQSTSKFWNFIDEADRYLYGRKMKNFLIGSLSVLIVAPILDWYLDVPYDRLTWHATFIFMIYVALIVLCWVSGWRDDKGEWTFKRAGSRLVTYYQTFRDTARSTRTSTRDEVLYNIGWWLFFGALGWKSLQILSIFIRKPIQNWTDHVMIRYINFENFTHKWFWVPLVFGVAIMWYLWRSDKRILIRIQRDLIQLFGRKKSTGFEAIKLENISGEKLVLNTNKDDHMTVISTTNSRLLMDFAAAIRKWQPGQCRYEYEFQDKLYRHLKTSLPDSVVELEYPIGDSAHGNKGRADIVIDETILIEMKRGDRSISATDRAIGQVSRYSEIWNRRGPVILLLCGYEFDHARLTFTTPMVNLSKLDRSVLTLVQEY